MLVSEWTRQAVSLCVSEFHLSRYIFMYWVEIYKQGEKERESTLIVTYLCIFELVKVLTDCGVHEFPYIFH